MVKASRHKVLLDKVLREDREIEHLVDKNRPSLLEVEARRLMLSDAGESRTPPAPRSMPVFVEVGGANYRVPDWLITEDFRDEVLGPIKGGKEAEVLLVERSSPGGEHLLALKRYRDPKTRAFRRDQIYREGRRMRRESRQQKAVENATAYGKKLIADQWSGSEFEHLRRLWAAGATVPFPVESAGSLLMQYIGDYEYAAPRLVDARLTQDEAAELLDQLIGALRLFSREGLVHGDLSAYNVLVWEGKAYVIDLPQAVDLVHNPHAFDFLHRDVTNTCSFFGKWKIDVDPEAIFADCVSYAF